MNFQPAKISNGQVAKEEPQGLPMQIGGNNRKEDTGELDCLLIYPYFKMKSDNVFGNQRSDDPPIGLMALASFVRMKGHSVKILDCNIEAREIEDFKAHLKKNYVDKNVSVRVFGFTTATLIILSAFKLAEICKQYYPNSTIVFGGAHASLMPEEAINNGNVDIVAIGEGELTLEEILSNKERSEIDGIIYKELRNNGEIEIRKTNPRKRIKDIDDLPIPAYDLIDISKYKPVTGAYKRLPAMLMVSSRGCPWSCIFCKGAFDGKNTYRSAENIFKEIEFLVKNYGIKQILFMDDVFMIHKKNITKLCDLLIENKTDIAWACFARVDVITPELLQKMKKAGCHQIMYGVESFDPGVLKTIKKGITKEQVFQAVEWTKKARIDVRLSFLLGLPGDTEEIILDNIKFIRQLSPDMLIVCIVVPFPGTELFNWAASRDLITTYDWDEYYGARPVIKIEHLSSQEISRLYIKMITSFYFRPGYIIKKLFKVNSWLEIRMLISGASGILNFLMTRIRNARTRRFIDKRKELEHQPQSKLHASIRYR